MGPGVALFDADLDGDLDLYVTNGRPWTWSDGDAPTTGRFYRNEDGRFADRTSEVGLDGARYCVCGQGATAGDYDGDGDWDLYVTTVGPNFLFRNEGGKFVDVTDEAGVRGGTWTDAEGSEHDEWSTSAGFCDLDGDGWLDLFVCNYLEWTESNNVDFILTGEIKGYASPKLYRGSSCRLYRNAGDGRFTDVTESSGIASTDHKALGVSFADADGDGKIDVFVANDTQPNCLFVNKGGMRFEDVGRVAGVGYGRDGLVRAGMGIDAAFYSSDDELAVAVGNFSQEPISFFRALPSPNILFTDDNVITGLGRSSGPSLTFSVAFFDANLDGHSDLLAINGHLEPDIQLVNPSTSYRQTAQLFLNRGKGGVFADASSDSGSAFAEELVGRGLALGDLDGDGDVDAVVAECGGPARVWLNRNPSGRKALRVRLEGPRPNVHAIGARVTAEGGPHAQTAWVRTGQAYLSQHEPTLTFGLGDAETGSVSVLWPDGKTSTFEGLTVGSEHLLRHPAL